MATNVQLQRQALTISQQIEELKNWHRQHQSRINLEEFTSEKDKFTETNPNKSEVKNIPAAITGTSQFSNLSSQQNFDELPIKVANPNFQDILENNIPPSENTLNDIPNRGTKEKFKFLKKGEGIARFRMRPQKIQNPKNRNARTLNLVDDRKRPTGKDLGTGDINIALKKAGYENKDDILTLEPPDVRLKFKDWRAILNGGRADVINSDHLEIFQPDSSIDSSMASLMEKLLVLGRKQIKENEELRIFELIEQKVLDSSFCSTSSNIAKLMENAVMSTPEKKSLATSSPSKSNAQTDKVTSVPQNSNIQKQDVQEFIEQKRPDPPIWIGPENIKVLNNQSLDESSIESVEESLHVRFSDKVDYKSFLEYSQSPKNLDLKETNTKTDFDESEEWNENSEESSRCCSQCSTSYSSSEEDMEAISALARPPSVNNCQNFPSSKEPMFQGQRQNSGISITGQNRIEAAKQIKCEHNNTKETVPESDRIDKLEPLLSAKVKELENEIENFRVENRKLKELRENLEKERKQFQQEKKKLLKEVDEEMKKNSMLFEEEKQKLAKEKMIFEKYSKSLTKNPTREERKEILGLKEQLSEMKEELNKKESRWAAAQARVRNQVKLLEEDNKKLREEVEVLRKQSKHLEFLSRKKKDKPFNNTKLIHAINDHLSKVVVSDEEEKGYFNKESNTYKIVQCEEVNPQSINTIRIIREERTTNSSKVAQNEYSDLIESSQNHAVQNEKPRQEVDLAPVQKQTSCRSETHHVNKTTDTIQVNNLQNMGNLASKSNSVEGDKINSVKETINEDGSLQKVYPDGRKELFFKSGNIKKIDPLTGNEKTIYFNGDVEEILRDGTVKYYFSDSRRWQTTFPDGLEVWDFPNGQVEKRHVNGTVEVIFINDVRKIYYPDGSEEIFYADGTTSKVDADKRKILCLPNGQKEIYTEECVRREYPDGTVKKLYPDGVTETVYSNGRVRVKDKQGNLVMDSGTLKL